MLAEAIQYLLFALLALVGPGLAAQRLARVPIDPALVLPLGTALAAGAYWLSLVLGQPALFPTIVLALDLAAILPARRVRLAAGPRLRAALAPLGAIVVLLAVTQYPWNRVGPTGQFLLDPLVPYDTTFHVGLSHELALGYPPELPGVAGFPLGYHLGTDLVRAAALRWAAVDPFDSITRFDVTLWALALVLALRGVTHRVLGNPRAVSIVAWTLLATDFSFLFFWNPQAHWWADLLRGNLLVSLCLSNPVIPALGLALGSLIAFSRFHAGEGRGWLWLAALQALAVPSFKVFLGAHLALGLGVAAVLCPRRRLLPILGLATTVALVTLAHVLGQGGLTVETALAPLDLVHMTRDSLQLPPLAGLHLLLWSGLWVTASLGLRLLGIWPAVRALRSDSPTAVTLAAMALSAWPLGLLFRVAAPELLSTERVVNDAAYLVEQGGPLLWIFTAGALAHLARTRRRSAIVAALAAALVLPSTAQFVIKKSRASSDPIPAPMVRAARALRRASQPGDVALQRPAARYPPVPVILAGRRVTFERFTPFLTQFAPREALQRRHEAVYRFFRTRDTDEARTLARELGARFVCLYGHDRVRFDTSGFWQPVHVEPEAKVYRILPPE